jgi:hypothetical protein
MESLRFSTVLPLLICISLVPFISFMFASLSVLAATVVGVILHILLAGSRQQFASSAIMIGTLLSRWYFSTAGVGWVCIAIP